MDIPQGGPLPQSGGQQQPQIDWSQTEDLKCEECESVYFKQSTMFKRVSKFMTGQDRDSLVPIQVIRCDECGHVNEDLKPQLPGQ